MWCKPRSGTTPVRFRRCAGLHHILPQYPGCLVTHKCLVLQIVLTIPFCFCASIRRLGIPNTCELPNTQEAAGACGVSSDVEPPPSDFAAAQAQSDIPSLNKEGRLSNLKPQTLTFLKEEARTMSSEFRTTVLV